MYALVCPDDVPEAEALQAHALAVSNQIGVPISIPRGARLETEIAFVFDNGQWQLEREPVQVVKGRPRYAPEGLARRYQARCHVRFRLTQLSRTDSIEAACETYRGERPTRIDGFEETAIEYVAQSVFAFEPGTAPRCAEVTLDYRIESDNQNDPPWGDTLPEGAPRCENSD